MQKSSAGTQAAVHQLEMEIRIAAPPSKVWKALVEDIVSWWPKDYFTSPRTIAMRLEPALGGRLYEDAGDGAGLVWYTVIGVDPGSTLDLAGHLTPAFGGPAVTMLRLELAEEGKGTLLALSDSTVGRSAPDGEATKRDGWLAIFDAGLRAWVERKK